MIKRFNLLCNKDGNKLTYNLQRYVSFRHVVLAVVVAPRDPVLGLGLIVELEAGKFSPDGIVRTILPLV